MLISVASPPALGVTEIHSALNTLFNDTAEHLARETRFCQRARKLPGPVFAKTPVFCLLKNPKATLDDFADFALKNLTVNAQPQSIDERFTQAAACFLQALLAE